MTPPANEPLVLDGVVFEPNGPDRETARQDGVLLGEVELDEIFNQWRARGVNRDRSFDDWRPMRCKAEARAYLVTRRGL
jgi:hypothetical protein